MSQAETEPQEIIAETPPPKPRAAKIRLEKRKRQKDRRKTNTYIADDQRSGIADRRKRRKDE